MGVIGEIEERERRMVKKAMHDETQVPQRIQNVSSQPLEENRHVERLFAWRNRKASADITYKSGCRGNVEDRKSPQASLSSGLPNTHIHTSITV